MSLILNIDTATESASICLAKDGQPLSVSYNETQKEHASWLHPAISNMLKDTRMKATDLAAVAITEGPGSYTGLRVGMATAKGLCYALNVPLVTVNTLEAMATVGIHEGTDLVCPMIDARRMEVFTAVYDKNLTSVIAPSAIILDKNSFSGLLKENTMLFFGNGKDKFLPLISQDNAVFKDVKFSTFHLSGVTYNKYLQSDFASLAYLEPNYLKEHQSYNITK